ncbi:MAG: OST3/OST6 family protein [Nitrososphaerota archaeon]|nr:OST3/OST6 family protein [Nitrososphaerota archaeon]
MSEKIKKHSEDMSFSLSRWFRKISTNTPTTFIIVVAVMAYAIFLFGGGLYTLINRPIIAYPGQNTIYFLYPSLSMQFGADTLISGILYALGFFGILAIYQSTKSAYKPKQAYMILIVGVALLLLSYIFIESAINFKITGGG